MNLTNAVPRSGTKQNCLLYAPCTIPVPIQNVAQSEGGVQQFLINRCNTAHFPISLPCTVSLTADSPASPCRTSG